MEHIMESSQHLHRNGDMKCNNRIQAPSKYCWCWYQSKVRTECDFLLANNNDNICSPETQHPVA